MDDRWLELTDASGPVTSAACSVLIKASAISGLEAQEDGRTAVFGTCGMTIVKESIDDIKAAMGIFPVKVSRGK